MADEYARKYMGGDRVRYLEKVRIPRWMHVLFLGSAAVGAGALVGAGIPELAPIFALPGVLSWGLLTAIRVSVTDTHLHLQYGVFGPTIALEDIVDVEAIAYEWWRFGGWGIRLAFNGNTALSIPNRGGKAVRVRYRRGTKVRTIVVTSEQPEALKAAIDRARAGEHRDLEAARGDVALGDGPLVVADVLDGIDADDDTVDSEVAAKQATTRRS